MNHNPPANALRAFLAPENGQRHAVVAAAAKAPRKTEMRGRKGDSSPTPDMYNPHVYAPGPMTGRPVRCDASAAPEPCGSSVATAGDTLRALREHGPTDAAALAMRLGRSVVHIRGHLLALRRLGVAAIVGRPRVRDALAEGRGGDVYEAVCGAGAGLLGASVEAPTCGGYLAHVLGALRDHGPMDIAALSLHLDGDAVQSSATRVRTALVVLVAEGHVLAREMPRREKLVHARRIYEVAP